MALKSMDIASVKGKGFLLNRGTENFSGRIVAPGTVFTARNFADMAALAEKFGNGKLICTSRQAVEVPGIAFENIPAAIEFAENHGLRFGGTGAKVRPVTACKGTTCVFGCCDTQFIAKRIHDEYYIGWQGVALPHKFKIAVGGCPNSCIKPSLNDLGIQAQRAAGSTVFRIFVGGTWGKKTRSGTPLSFTVGEEGLMPLVEKVLLWYRENGYAKERFGMTVDRLGIQALEAELLSDGLLLRREEILSGEIKTREA